MKKLALKLIRFYQHYLNWLNGPMVCRFSPTCSEHTYQAINKYGILRGGILGIKQILCCQPLYKG